MGSDPDPSHSIRFDLADGTVTIANSYRDEVAIALKPPESAATDEKDLYAKADSS
jgi:hypothetical protein